MELPGWLRPWQTPDRAAALNQYRRRARFYDLQIALAEPIRRRAAERLGLRPGETVLDVGCGTGLSLAILEEWAGPKGRIVGIEQSPEMIEQAQERVARNGWDNVTLLCSPVEEASIPVAADAAFFFFTHDILRTREALANVLRHLKFGARVVSAGLKWAPAWEVPANLLVLQAAFWSVTSFEGLRAPWDLLAALGGELEVEELLGRAIFIASGAVTRSGCEADAAAR